MLTRLYAIGLALVVIGIFLWHWWAGLIAVGLAWIISICRVAGGCSRAEEQRVAQAARFSCDGDDDEELSG